MHKACNSSSPFIKCRTLSTQKYQNVWIILPQSNPFHLLNVFDNSYLHLCVSKLWASTAQQVNSCYTSMFEGLHPTCNSSIRQCPITPMLLVAWHDIHEHFCHTQMQFLHVTAVQLYLHPSWNPASRILTFAYAVYLPPMHSDAMIYEVAHVYCSSIKSK